MPSDARTKARLPPDDHQLRETIRPDGRLARRARSIEKRKSSDACDSPFEHVCGSSDATVQMRWISTRPKRRNTCSPIITCQSSSHRMRDCREPRQNATAANHRPTPFAPRSSVHPSGRPRFPPVECRPRDPHKGSANGKKEPPAKQLPSMKTPSRNTPRKTRHRVRMPLGATPIGVLDPAREVIHAAASRRAPARHSCCCRGSSVRAATDRRKTAERTATAPARAAASRRRDQEQ